MKVSVAVILFSSCKQKILLIKRRDVPVFALPGGGVDPGETFEEAAIRETFEETGLHVAIHRTVGYYYPINKLTYPTLLFECIPIDGSIQITDETAAIQYFSLDRLPKEVPPPYPDWIQDAVLSLPAVFKPISSVTYLKFFYFVFRYPILVTRFILSRLKMPINSPKRNAL